MRGTLDVKGGVLLIHRYISHRKNKSTTGIATGQNPQSPQADHKQTIGHRLSAVGRHYADYATVLVVFGAPLWKRRQGPYDAPP